MLALAAALLTTAAPTQQPTLYPREWVVKELLRPEPAVGHAGFFWENAYALGDVDRDGLPDVGFLGRSWDPGVILERRVRLTRGALLDTARDLIYPASPVSITFGSDFGPTAALLATPGGAQLVLASLAQPGLLEFRDAQSLAPLGTAVGSGLPRALLSAGDLDADGWDDFFALGSPLHVAAYSGRTRARLWQEVFPPPHAVAWAAPFASPLPPDLDGDGVGDLLLAARVYTRPGTYTWTVFALSGTDGTRIWRTEGVSGGSDPLLLAQGPDWTGDGVADCALVASDTLAAFDGATGALQWQQPRAALAPLLNSPLLDVYVFPRPLLTRPAGDPTRVDLVLPVWELANLTPWESTFALLHLDAATGQLLLRDPLPADVFPFDVHTLVANGSQPPFMPLGDVDRDGLVDVALEIGFANETSGEFGMPPGGDIGIALLGPRTLAGPGRVSLQRNPTFELALPGAAGRGAFLVASTLFDRAGGVRFGDWRTHLVADGLYGFVLGQPVAAVTLDARGRGFATLPLPPQPALAGRTLTLRGLVPAATGPGLWTASTLHRLELVP